MLSSPRIDVLVIGAGVSGLTTAVRFLDAGLSVRVLAARAPRHTTSAAAGASWGPYIVSDPRVLPWSDRARRVLEDLARDPATGVRLVSGLEASVESAAPPSWAIGVRGFRRCDPDELPDGYESGWRYTIPVVDMPRYLAYLVGRLSAGGVQVEIGQIDSFDEVAGAARMLVNCSGLGSRSLVPDDKLFPTRGQLVVVANPGIDQFFQDDAEDEQLTYILPHGDHVVLGGSAIPYSEDEVPDPHTAASIVERCSRLEPSLRTARVLRHLVGLRPTRPEVRVESDEVAGTPLIHNYGHGGAGLTLSWGCADEVLALSGLR
jgi:D-amino-acid oxidase